MEYFDFETVLAYSPSIDPSKLPRWSSLAGIFIALEKAQLPKKAASER
jgi:hypothetical protein